MCDPLTLGSLAIGVAGTAASSIGQMSAQKKQESEYNRWVQQQKKNRELENQRQESLRQQAEAARQQGVNDISADNQKKLQSAEEERLATELAGEGDVQATPDPAAPTSVADPMLSGSQGGGEVFQSDLASALSDAAASAKQRIGALATVNAYNDSESGLATVNPINQARAGAGIDAANNARRGSLAAYQTEQAVEPVQVSYSNPIADIASSFLGVGLQGLGGAAAGGSSVGQMMAGALGKGVTSTLPGFAPIPTPRPSVFPATMTPPAFRQF